MNPTREHEDEPGRFRAAGLRRGAARLAGEFVVIVLGVLVALAVDEWREVRAEREREVGYYRSIRDDLDRDLEEFDFALEFSGASLVAARDVLAVIEGRAREAGAGATRGFRLISDVDTPTEAELAALDRDLVRRLRGDPELRGIVRGMIIGEWTTLIEMLDRQRATAEGLWQRVDGKLRELEPTTASPTT